MDVNNKNSKTLDLYNITILTLWKVLCKNMKKIKDITEEYKRQEIEESKKISTPLRIDENNVAELMKEYVTIAVKEETTSNTKSISPGVIDKIKKDNPDIAKNLNRNIKLKTDNINLLSKTSNELIEVLKNKLTLVENYISKLEPDKYKDTYKKIEDYLNSEIIKIEKLYEKKNKDLLKNTNIENLEKQMLNETTTHKIEKTKLEKRIDSLTNTQQRKSDTIDKNTIIDNLGKEITEITSIYNTKLEVINKNIAEQKKKLEEEKINLIDKEKRDITPLNDAKSDLNKIINTINNMFKIKDIGESTEDSDTVPDDLFNKLQKIIDVTLYNELDSIISNSNKLKLYVDIKNKLNKFLEKVNKIPENLENVKNLSNIDNLSDLSERYYLLKKKDEKKSEDEINKTEDKIKLNTDSLTNYSMYINNINNPQYDNSNICAEINTEIEKFLSKTNSDENTNVIVNNNIVFNFNLLLEYRNELLKEEDRMNLETDITSEENKKNKKDKKDEIIEKKNKLSEIKYFNTFSDWTYSSDYKYIFGKRGQFESSEKIEKTLIKELNLKNDIALKYLNNANKNNSLDNIINKINEYDFNITLEIHKIFLTVLKLVCNEKFNIEYFKEIRKNASFKIFENNVKKIGILIQNIYLKTIEFLEKTNNVKELRYFFIIQLKYLQNHKDCFTLESEESILSNIRFTDRKIFNDKLKILDENHNVIGSIFVKYFYQLQSKLASVLDGTEYNELINFFRVLFNLPNDAIGRKMALEQYTSREIALNEVKKNIENIIDKLLGIDLLQKLNDIKNEKNEDNDSQNIKYKKQSLDIEKHLSTFYDKLAKEEYSKDKFVELIEQNILTVELIKNINEAAEEEAKTKVDAETEGTIVAEGKALGGTAGKALGEGPDKAPGKTPGEAATASANVAATATANVAATATANVAATATANVAATANESISSESILRIEDLKNEQTIPEKLKILKNNLNKSIETQDTTANVKLINLIDDFKVKHYELYKASVAISMSSMNDPKKLKAMYKILQLLKKNKSSISKELSEVSNSNRSFNIGIDSSIIYSLDEYFIKHNLHKLVNIEQERERLSVKTSLMPPNNNNPNPLQKRELAYTIFLRISLNNNIKEEFEIELESYLEAYKELNKIIEKYDENAVLTYLDESDDIKKKYDDLKTIENDIKDNEYKLIDTKLDSLKDLKNTNIEESPTLENLNTFNNNLSNLVRDLINEETKVNTYFETIEKFKNDEEEVVILNKALKYIYTRNTIIEKLKYDKADSDKKDLKTYLTDIIKEAKNIAQQESKTELIDAILEENESIVTDLKREAAEKEKKIPDKAEGAKKATKETEAEAEAAKLKEVEATEATEAAKKAEDKKTTDGATAEASDGAKEAAEKSDEETEAEAKEAKEKAEKEAEAAKEAAAKEAAEKEAKIKIKALLIIIKNLFKDSNQNTDPGASSNSTGDINELENIINKLINILNLYRNEKEFLNDITKINNTIKYNILVNYFNDYKDNIDLSTLKDKLKEPTEIIEDIKKNSIDSSSDDSITNLEQFINTYINNNDSKNLDEIIIINTNINAKVYSTHFNNIEHFNSPIKNKIEAQIDEIKRIRDDLKNSDTDELKNSNTYVLKNPYTEIKNYFQDKLNDLNPIYKKLTEINIELYYLKQFINNKELINISENMKKHINTITRILDKYNIEINFNFNNFKLKNKTSIDIFKEIVNMIKKKDVAPEEVETVIEINNTTKKLLQFYEILRIIVQNIYNGKNETIPKFINYKNNNFENINIELIKDENILCHMIYICIKYINFKIKYTHINDQNIDINSEYMKFINTIKNDNKSIKSSINSISSNNSKLDKFLKNLCDMFTKKPSKFNENSPDQKENYKLENIITVVEDINYYKYKNKKINNIYEYNTIIGPLNQGNNDIMGKIDDNKNLVLYIDDTNIFYITKNNNVDEVQKEKAEKEAKEKAEKEAKEKAEKEAEKAKIKSKKTTIEAEKAKTNLKNSKTDYEIALKRYNEIILELIELYNKKIVDSVELYNKKIVDSVELYTKDNSLTLMPIEKYNEQIHTKNYDILSTIKKDEQKLLKNLGQDLGAKYVDKINHKIISISDTNIKVFISERKNLITLKDKIIVKKNKIIVKENEIYNLIDNINIEDLEKEINKNNVTIDTYTSMMDSINKLIEKLNIVLKSLPLTEKSPINNAFTTAKNKANTMLDQLKTNVHLYLEYTDNKLKENIKAVEESEEESTKSINEEKKAKKQLNDMENKTINNLIKNNQITKINIEKQSNLIEYLNDFRNIHIIPMYPKQAINNIESHIHFINFLYNDNNDNNDNIDKNKKKIIKNIIELIDTNALKDKNIPKSKSVKNIILVIDKIKKYDIESYKSNNHKKMLEKELKKLIKENINENLKTHYNEIFITTKNEDEDEDDEEENKNKNENPNIDFINSYRINKIKLPESRESTGGEIDKIKNELKKLKRLYKKIK